MNGKTRGVKGQFSMIAALLVAVIIVAGVVTTYSLIRDNPFIRPPNILSSIEEMNLSIKRILEFTVGYYGSILQVTGNTSYADAMTWSYLESGFINIARLHPDWSPSFEFNSSRISSKWFAPTSYSIGNISVKYSLDGLGISGIEYETSCGLKTIVLESHDSSKARILVTREGNKPDLTLGRENFRFYSYSYTGSVWELLYPASDPVVFSNGTYVLQIPEGVDEAAYMIQVVDSRGIMVTVSSFSHYTYTFTWNSTLYSSLTKDTIVVEMLQNGTLRWLGQNLKLTTSAKPIPPIPVKAFRLNQTINGVNREVPFQIEDWASDYRVPLGLTSNASVFGNRHILVFLVNHNVSEVTLWWDGRNTANQTSYAWKNRYFTDDISNPNHATLSNGELTLVIHKEWSEYSVTATLGSTSSKAEFLRINGEKPVYGASPSYVIHHGVIRDIVQQEAEWSGGATNCPNIYAQIVVMLPANTTYYTYFIRIIFVNSEKDRSLSDLSIIQLNFDIAKSAWGAGWGQTLAENGTSGGIPLVSTILDETALFYNFSGVQTGWAHHWAEYVENNYGSGLMFTNSSNFMLYVFDDIAGDKTGALSVTDTTSGNMKYITIEVTPANRYEATFTHALDVSWYGAVVMFDGNNPIYPSDGTIGLWVLVEHPPTVAVS